ncbi:MAG: pilin [Patescibacteria group bacterium]|jgi:hypothetical protein
MRILQSLKLSLIAFALPLTTRAAELTNPLGVDDAKEFVVRVLRYSLGLLGVVALIMILYGGFLMLTSAGSADQIKKAKGTIIWAAVGIAVILLSWTILQYIFQTLNEVAS